jgi:UDP-2,3-diacylglucosamine pyrophosphatase LpxH
MEFLSEEWVPENLSVVTLPREEMIIVPIGDVHFGNRGFAADPFKRYLETVEEEFENIYYIGMGDYLDATRTTLRKSIQSLEPDDGDAMDDYVQDKLYGFYELIKHTKGKWLGMLQGNHRWHFRQGDTTESRLCTMLDTTFLGDCADIQLRFLRGDSPRARGSVGVWVHHGVGGRKYPVGKLIDDICPHFPDNDIFLMGHTHIREYRDFPRLHRVGKKYIERTGVAAITGGWLQGYKRGPSSYVERKAMKPRAIGSLVIKVRPRQATDGTFSPVLRVETI